MEDSKFLQLADSINKLIMRYQAPANSPDLLKHHTYVAEYDKLLERYGVTKTQLIAEIARRKKK